MGKILLILSVIVIVIVGLVVIRRDRVSTTTSPTSSNNASANNNVPSVTGVNLPKVTIKGSQLIDSSTNNLIILKGFVTIVNIYAYNDNSFQDYTTADYQKMKSYGANYQSIRLGGKAIGSGGGNADSSYLQKTDQMVANAANAGLYSSFKLTVFDMNGFSGLQKDKSWGNFWRNKNGEQDQFIAGWKNIWLRYKDNTSVVGFDLLNEPNKGDLGVSDTEFVNNYLGPFYQKAIDALRTIDTTHLVYFQPGLNGFEDIPFRYVLNRDNVVYSPHFYPAVQAYLQALYGKSFDTFALIPNYSSLMQQFMTDASTNNAPLLLGEYGMPWDPQFDGDSAKESAYTTLETTAMDLFAQNKASYSRPWYSDDKAGVKLSKVDLNWGLIKGTSGLNGTPRDFIFNVFKSHSLK